MKPQKILLILMVLLESFAFAQTPGISTTTILFAKNSTSISLPYSRKLDSLLKTIGKEEELGITGYSDTDGDEWINTSVSKHRAIAVKNYLRSKGFKNKIHLDFKGEGNPLNTNSDDQQKAANRRVEILHDWAKYNDVFNAFKKEYDVYEINPFRDTLLRCAGGLTLNFPAGVFASKSRELVTIKVQEFYTADEFVLAGLNTQGPGNSLLESGGMMNIEAWQSGKKLEIKSGQQVGVLFKNRQTNDGMQLFNAEVSTSSMSWLQAVSDTAVLTTKHTIRTKELMRVSYSVPDTAYVYSHYWEEGPYKITKSTMKGEVRYDTSNDETSREVVMMLGTAKLGWINCDRFIYSNKPITELAVTYTSTITPFVSIVFKNINSIMASNGAKDKSALFKGVPEDKEVTVIGIFKRKDSNKVFFAMQSAISGRDKNVRLKFEELSPAEVKERLKSL